MTMEDAIRILNPDHHLHPGEGIEDVEEACRIAIKAIQEVLRQYNAVTEMIDELNQKGGDG